jgi:hypothetical protein
VKTLDELLAEEEPERLKRLAEDDARTHTPEAIARHAQRLKEEHERGVRLGWWDEEGNPFETEVDDDEAEGDD